MITRTSSRIWIVWAGGGLIANFAWEMLHMPLYGKFKGGWWGCFQASLGDVALLALLYALMACAAEDWIWFERLSRRRLLLLAMLGFLVAVVIEQRALLAGVWTYRPGMPRLPFLGIGWSPVLQMILIPLGLAGLSRSWALRGARDRGGPLA
jgi:hypothetical protein